MLRVRGVGIGPIFDLKKIASLLTLKSDPIDVLFGVRSPYTVTEYRIFIRLYHSDRQLQKIRTDSVNPNPNKQVVDRTFYKFSYDKFKWTNPAVSSSFDINKLTGNNIVVRGSIWLYVKLDR